jgi:hypothetical protein
MPSFYFLWDPTNYPEFCEELREIVPLLATGQWTEDSTWSTGRRTKTDFPPKSRFFMVRVGQEPRGVIGYGTIPTGELSPPHSHWDPRKDQKDIPYVNIRFENLIDSEQHPEKVV